MIYTRTMTADDMLMCERCGTAVLTTQEKVDALSKITILIECIKGGLHKMKKYSPLAVI